MRHALSASHSRVLAHKLWGNWLLFPLVTTLCGSALCGSALCGGASGLAGIVGVPNRPTSDVVITCHGSPAGPPANRAVLNGTLEFLAVDRVSDQQVSRGLHPAQDEGGPAKALTADSQPAAQAVRQWRVAKDGSGQFTTIRQAMTRAAKGDQIIIAAGVYRESVVVDKSLTLAAEPSDRRPVIQSDNGDCLWIQAPHVQVRGLELRGRAGQDQEFFALDIASDDALVENCLLTSNSLACLGIHGDGVRAVVKNCWLFASRDAGIFIYDGGHATIEDCEIFNNRAAGLALEGQAFAAIRDCRIHHNRAEGISVTKRSKAIVESCTIFANGAAPTLVGPGSTLQSHKNRVLENFLPVESVRTSIDDNDQAVDPELDEIIVTFPQPMDTEGWYVGPAGKSKGNFPALKGDEALGFRDPHTFFIKVQLEPGTNYALRLNSPRHPEFQSALGVPLEDAVIRFRTASAATTDSTETESGFEIGLKVLTFLERPTNRHFVEAREAVLASKDYRAATGNELDEIAALLKEHKFKEAQTAVHAYLPRLYLSPRVHLFAAKSLEGMWDDESARIGDDSIRKERQYARNCLDAIHASGDGTSERPYLVLRIEDEYDLISVLDKQVFRQMLVRDQGKTYDVFEFTDGSKFWFDASAFQ